MPAPHIHFVTGKLAEARLREVVAPLAAALGFDYSIQVMPITVAALMSPEWIAARVAVPPEATRLVIPGYCGGDLTPIERAAGLPVECGPRDLHELPDYFGQAEKQRDDYGACDIQILAEINHAPRLSFEAILREAKRFAAAGADLVDLGCNPGETWPRVGECVAMLRAEGLRVSIDSWNIEEIAAAAKAGAELVLSVNGANRHAAADWGVEVVAIPDDPATLAGLDETLEALDKARVPYRIDPILEPIGFGFANSLQRYWEVRRRWPQAEMLMGIGNLTELTDADSAGANVLLLGYCQELGIRSVLTTEVINWARSSVRECDLARRLVHYAVTHRTLPKRLEPLLVMLRDGKLYPQGEAALAELAAQIRDHNYRLFAEEGQLHLIAAQTHLADADPFVLFDKLRATNPKNLDAAHAFYLGYELCKAMTALTLDKQYRQDEALDWGFLTVSETSHRLK